MDQLEFSWSEEWLQQFSEQPTSTPDGEE